MTYASNGSKRNIMLGLIVGILFLSSCTSTYKSSGFLGDYTRLKKGEHFEQEFIPAGTDFSKYTKVYVKPIEMKYFEDPYEHLKPEDEQKLAERFKVKLEEAFAKKYKILAPNEKPDGETLVLEAALLYVAEPERLLNVATSWFAGLSISKGFAAFEAKISDGATGQKLLAVAEKRQGGGGVRDVRSIAVGSFERFRHAEGAFSRWGDDVVKLIDDSGKPS